MKSKKLFLPIVIIASAILLMAVYIVLSGFAYMPTITEEQFDFSITYVYNGETKVIDGTYTAAFERFGGYTDNNERYYTGTISGKEANNFSYVLMQDGNEQILLVTNLLPDRLMGDPLYDYDDTPDVPEIYYYDDDGISYSDEEILSSKGVKLISWDYPEPIENDFKFSHVSRFSGSRTLIPLLISVLAIVACMIFVKKDNDYVKKPADVISTVFNYVAAFAVLPFFTILDVLSDINGCSGELFHQIVHFLPMFIALSIALSICLRRKGYGKSSLYVQTVWIAPFIISLIGDIV